MAFKLKLKQVQLSGSKASPFKINESLVAGAGIAAKGFSTDLGGASRAMAKPVQVGGGDEGSGSDTATAAQTSQKCEDRDLTGDALAKCQELTNTKFLTDTAAQEKAIADAKLKKDTATKASNDKQDAYCLRNPNKKACKNHTPQGKTEDVADVDTTPAPLPTE